MKDWQLIDIKLLLESVHPVLIVSYAAYVLVSISVLSGLKYHTQWLGKLNEEIVSNIESE